MWRLWQCCIICCVVVIFLSFGRSTCLDVSFLRGRIFEKETAGASDKICWVMVAVPISHGLHVSALGHIIHIYNAIRATTVRWEWSWFAVGTENITQTYGWIRLTYVWCAVVWILRSPQQLSVWSVFTTCSPLSVAVCLSPPQIYLLVTNWWRAIMVMRQNHQTLLCANQTAKIPSKTRRFTFQFQFEYYFRISLWHNPIRRQCRQCNAVKQFMTYLHVLY